MGRLWTPLCFDQNLKTFLATLQDPFRPESNSTHVVTSYLKNIPSEIDTAHSKRIPKLAGHFGIGLKDTFKNTFILPSVPVLCGPKV